MTTSFAPPPGYPGEQYQPPQYPRPNFSRKNPGQASPDPSRQEKAMFMNPYISGELARQRQHEMLAEADRHRLARQLHATSGTARSGQRPRQRLRDALRAAARPGWLSRPVVANSRIRPRNGAEVIVTDERDPAVDTLVARPVAALGRIADWPEDEIDALVAALAAQSAGHADELAAAAVAERASAGRPTRPTRTASPASAGPVTDHDSGPCNAIPQQNSRERIRPLNRILHRG